VEYSGSITYQKSRMAQAGKTITMMIVWFQFIATQVVAVIIFCNSINSEIYRRTLGVLLTTPVNSFQIIAGKLISKLFQIFILLAINLPLLAIVRIFGGVSWNYIISSLCITLVTVIFAGSLSMFFSILFKRAYVVIIVTSLTLGMYFGISSLVSGIITKIFRTGFNFAGARYLYFNINPFELLERISQEMMNPGGRIRIGSMWIIYCYLTLTASLVLLFLSALIVRGIARASAMVQKSIFERIINHKKLYEINPSDSNKSILEGKIRHVRGSAIVWKELISRYSSKQKLFVSIVISTEIIMIIAMYLFPYIASEYGYDETHMIYLSMFMGLAIISTAIFSTSCITSEKEAQTWPLLLMTTLSKWQILYGKYLGVLRRSLPVWILFFIYFFPFTNIDENGYISPIFMIFFTCALIYFIGCMGIYFSSRCKDTSIVFLASIIFMLIVWLVIPAALDYYSHGHFARNMKYSYIFDNIWIGNTFMEALRRIISSISVRRNYYGWSDNYRSYMSPNISMIWILITYITAGSVFAWRAASRFRKGIV
jgi:ABC-type transport system involved in multi-copper enzyme maturation permease subunit